MSKAKAGDTVSVHYTGRLDDGTVFDSSEGRDPLSFELGSGQVISGFDEGVSGMEVGDKKTVTIPSDQAYGAYDDDQVLEVSKDLFPEGQEPVVGQQVQVQTQTGQQAIVTIKKVEGDSVLLDANHPLAGQDLTFELELVGIDQ